MQRVGVVDGYAKLEGGARLVAHEQDVGEEDGVPLGPLVIGFVLPEQQAALDDAELELVEPDIHVLPG